MSDKPAFVRTEPRVSDDFRDRLRDECRDRLGTLLSVDGMVSKVLDALRDSGELADTLVVFTSDNGYLMGEHRLYGKVRLYEESARVPLIVRGPGFPAGVQREASRRT